MADNRLIICATCSADFDATEPEAVVELFAKSFKNSDIADDFTIVSTQCLGACETPRAIAIQGRRKATYVFSGISLESDIEDIIATCKLYLTAPDGLIVDARPCGRLRDCLRARIPALTDG